MQYRIVSDCFRIWPKALPVRKQPVGMRKVSCVESWCQPTVRAMATGWCAEAVLTPWNLGDHNVDKPGISKTMGWLCSQPSDHVLYWMQKCVFESTSQVCQPNGCGCCGIRIGSWTFVVVLAASQKRAGEDTSPGNRLEDAKMNSAVAYGCRSHSF